MSQHTIKMSVELDVLKSSIDDIQKVLNTLKPDTKAFTALQNVVKSMTKDLSQAETNIAKGFSSNADFKATEKIILRISAALAKTGEITKGIQFSDLKLDKATADQYSKLVDDLKKAQQEYNNFQKNMVKNTLAQGNNKQILLGIDPDLVNKSFDEIVEGIANGVKAAEDELQQLQEAYNKLLEQMTKTQKVQSKVDSGSGDTLSGLLDPAAFKKFFSTKQNGDVMFKSIKGGGIQLQFLQYLQLQFNIPDNKIEELRNKTAKQIQNILGSTNFWEGITQGQQAQKIDLSNMMGDIQANIADFTQLGQAFGLTGAQATQFGSNIINLINSIKNLENGVLGANGAINNMPASMNAAQSQLQSFKSQLLQAQGSMLKFQQMQNTFNSIKTAVLNFMGFTQVLSLVKRGVKDAAKNIKELDTVMNGIAIVTKMSTSDLWNQVDAYTKMAQQYGVTTKGAYEVSKIYYQQGLLQKDVMALTEETLKLSKISGLDYATTTDYMTTALRGFKMLMTDASRVVDVYSALAANTAVSQQLLAEAMTRTASSMESVGSTFEESSAMISTMVAVTRLSASNIGSALKSIASRYGEMKKAPEDLMDSEGEVLSFNKVDAALQSVGINMKTAEGQFRSFTDVIVELSLKWNTLESTQQRYIATQFAGNRQQSRFLALVSNGELLKKNLQVAEESEGTGTAQALTALDSLLSKINQVQNAYQQFYLGIGVEDVWKGFLDGAKNVLNTLNSFPKLFNKLPITAIASITNLINIFKTVLLSGLQGLAAVITPIIHTLLQKAGQQIQQDGQTMGSNLMAGMKAGLMQQFNSKSSMAAFAGQIISSISLFMNRLTLTGEMAAGILNSIGGVVQGWAGAVQLMHGDPRGLMNLFSGVMSLWSGIATAIPSNLKTLERLTKQAKDLSDNAAQLKGLEKSIQNLKNEYDTLKEKQYDSKLSAQEFQDIQNKIAEQFPGLVSSLDNLGNATINAAAMEEQLTAARQAAAEAALAAALAELKKRLQEEANIKQSAKLELIGRENIFLSNIGQASSFLGYNFSDNYKELNKYVKNGSYAFNQLQNGFNFENGLTIDLNWMLGLFTEIFASGDVQQLFGENSANFSAQFGQIFDLDPLKGLNNLINSIANNGIVDTSLLGQELRSLIDNYMKLLEFLGSGEESIETAAQEFSNAINIFKNSSGSDQDWDNLNNAYNKFNQAYQQYLDAGGPKREGIEAELKTYSEILQKVGYVNNATEAGKRNVLLEKFKNKQLELSISNKSSILDNNIMSTLISNNILQSKYLGDVNKYWETQEKNIDELQKQWLDLSPLSQLKISSNLSNLKYISDINTLLDLTGIGIDTAIGTFLRGILDNKKAEIGENLLSYLNNRADKTKRSSLKGIFQESFDDIGIDTEIEENIARDVTNYLEQIQDYTSNENLIEAKTEGIDLITSMLQLPKEIADIIDANGLLTIENIDKSLASIDAVDQSTLTDAQKSALEQAKTALLKMKLRIATNLALSIQSMGDSLLKNFEDEQKNINKLSSGASASEMKATLDKLNSWGGKGKGAKFTNADVIVDASGKLVLTLQAYEQAVQTFYQHTAELITKLQEQLTEGQELLKQRGDKNTILDNVALFKSILSAEEYNKFFELNVLNGEITDIKFIGKLDALTNLEGGIGEYQDLLDKAKTAMTRQAKWKKGDYSDLDKSIALLASTDTKKLTLIEYQAVKQYRTGLAQLLEDIATKDLDTIDAKDYEGVSKATVNNIIRQAKDPNVGREMIIKRYSSQLGADVETLNNLIFQAMLTTIQQTTPHLSNAAKDIVSSLQFFDEQVAYITKLLAEKWANLYNIKDFTKIYNKDATVEIDGKVYYQVVLNAYKTMQRVPSFLTLQAVSLSKNLADFSSFFMSAQTTTGISGEQKEDFKKLAQAFNINLTDEMFEAAEDNVNNYQFKDNIDMSIFQQALINGQTKLSLILKTDIAKNARKVYDSAFNELSKVSKIQTSGITSLTLMQEIVDVIKNSGTYIGDITNVTTASCFEYSTALHGFVMTANAVQQYIAALTKAMQDAGKLVNLLQILDQTRMQALANNDIDAFVLTYRFSSAFANMPDYDWKDFSNDISNRIKNGDYTALRELPGAITYMDLILGAFIDRASAISNLVTTLMSNGKLTATDISKNMSAFKGTQYENWDAAKIIQQFTDISKLQDFVNGLDEEAQKAFTKGRLEGLQKNSELLLKAAENEAKLNIEEIEQIGRLLQTSALIDNNGNLTAAGLELFTKESGFYKSKGEAIRSKIKTESSDQNLLKEINKIEADVLKKENDIYQEIFNQLIAAQNLRQTKKLDNVSDEMLAIVNNLSPQIKALIDIDTTKRSLTFKPNYVGKEVITRELKKYQDKLLNYETLIASIKGTDENKALILLKLINSATDVDATIVAQVKEAFGDIGLVKQLATSGKYTANLSKIQLQTTNLKDASNKTLNDLNKALEQNNISNYFNDFLTTEIINLKLYQNRVAEYNKLWGTNLTIPKESWFTKINDTEWKWNIDSLKTVAQEYSVDQLTSFKNNISNANEQLYTILKKMLENEELNEDDILTLKTHGIDKNLPSDIKLTDVIDKYLLEISTVPSLLQLFAQDMLENGNIPKFVEAITLKAKALGYDNFDTKASFNLQQALYNRDLNSLESINNEYGNILGNLLPILIEKLNNDIGAIFSNIISESAATKNGYQGYIGVKNNPTLKNIIQNLGLSDILTADILLNGLIIGYYTKGIGQIKDAFILAIISNTTLTEDTKYELLKTINQATLSKITSTNLASLLTSSYKDISYDTISDLSQSLGKQASELDEFISEFFTKEGDRYTQTIEQRQKLLDDNRKNLTKEQQNAAQRSIDDERRKQSQPTALRNAILNWDNITHDIMDDLSYAYNMTYEELSKWFVYDPITNRFKPQFNALTFAAANKMNNDSEVNKILNLRAQLRSQTIVDAFEALDKSISTGIALHIYPTENTKGILEEFAKMFPDEIKAIENESGNVIEYAIKGALGSIDILLNYLEYLRTDKTMQSLLGISSLQVDSLILSFSSKKSGKQIIQPILDNYLSSSYSAIEKASLYLGIEINEMATKIGPNEYKIKNFEKIKEKIQEKLKLGQITLLIANDFIAQIEQIEYNDSPAAAMDQIIVNNKNITDLMINHLARVSNLTREQILEVLTLEGDHRVADMSALRALIEALDLGATEIITKHVASLSDEILDSLSQISSQQTSGTTSVREMRTNLDKINEGLAQKFSLSDIYEYSDVTHSYIMTQAGVQAQMKKVNQLIAEADDKDKQLLEKQKDIYFHNLAEQVNFSDYFSASSTLLRNKQAKILQQAVKNYNTGLYAEYGDQAKQITDELFASALSGDLKAVQSIYKQMGKELSSSDYQALLEDKGNRLIAATEVFTSSIGTYIDAVQALLLNKAGGEAKNIEGTNLWQITKALNPNQLAEAYMQAYLIGLENNLSQDKLRDLLQKSWDASTAPQKGISDALKNAASMTMSEFGDFLVSQGYTLSLSLIQQMQSEGIFSQLKDGNLRLNLEKFANKFNIDKSSREYIDAYSSLQDTIIKLQTQQRENILSEIKSILEAKPGDELNLSLLLSVFDKNFLTVLGLDFINGIALITEDTNLTQVAARIAQACSDAGAIIPEQLQEIEDAIEEVLQNFIDALSSGIKGNLSNSGKRDVINQAKQLLGYLDLTLKDFIRTADGFKLTTDAAIQMYSALQKVDSIQASKLFEDLADRTFGSNAGMLTMTGQMAKIAELQRQINDLREKASTAGEEKAQGAISNTIAKLLQLLALYQQVAQARAGGNPLSYDFMGQSLPNYLKGPENYWNAWGNAFQAMHNAAENGGYSIQEFYNIVNEMNNIAGLTGQKFQIFGLTLDGGILGMTKLIEKGFKTIKNIDGKGAKVTLEGIGIDFESGAAGMGANIEDGIHAMAQSQIDMLDGLIAFLLTIVAMQKLGDVDTNFSGSIDLGEIFANGKDWAGGFTQTFEDFRAEILKTAETNLDLKKAIDNTQITLDGTTMSLREFFTKSAKQFQDVGIDATTYQQAVDAFYKLVQSKDFNLLNPLTQENLQLIAQSGLNLEYTIPGTDKKIVIQDGKYLISNLKGLFIVDGERYKDVNLAFKAQNKLLSKQIIEQFKLSHRGSETLKILEADLKHIKILTNGKTYDIQADLNGKFTINGEGSYDTWAQVLQKMVDDLNKQIKEDGGKQLSTLAAKIRLGITALPEAITSVSQLSATQIQQLKAAGLDTKEKIEQAFKDDPEECEVRFKFKLAKDSLLESNFNENLQSRMEQADINLTANITADGQHVEVTSPVLVDLIAKSVTVPDSVEVPINGSGAQSTINPTENANAAMAFFSGILSQMFPEKNQKGQNNNLAAIKAQEAIKSNLDGLILTVRNSPIGKALETSVQGIKLSIGKLLKKLLEPSQLKGSDDNKGKSNSRKEESSSKAQSEAQTAALEILNQATTAVSEAGGKVGPALTQVGEAVGAMADAASSAASGIQGTADAIRASYNAMPSGVKEVSLQVTVSVTASAAKGTVNSVDWSPKSLTFHGGGFAVAAGQKTLMGLLGPELVVSNGQYYVVGQSGALMVDLAPDAIVFNHLQTKKLLSNGHTGRGKPITNERVAVSLAKGTGPAMASALAVLAALKQIRAMWQAMLGASMKDLGALAGNEGGGGGGGGGKKKPQQLKAILDDIERWYNLVRQIDRIEQDITYQESLQAKIQSDRIANGKALYKSQKLQLKLLDELIIRNQLLADLQKSFYERRRQDFADSDYGIFYTYDDQGQLQLRDGIDKGMDALFKLNEKGVYGETTGAATNAKTQIEYLKSIGFNTENLMYNGDGTKIDRNDEAYKDNPDKIYEDMMDNFWENLDGWKDELDSIYDLYREQLNTVIENLDRRNLILQAIVDNQLSVLQDVLKAIESREQKLIDELQDQRDALEDSTQRFIDGLSDQLKEERQMYENEETLRELVKLRRQVAILQRSGGSASQIRSLQDQIAAKLQDQYFDQQLQQIAAIQKASDLQIERLDSQIDLMTKALEYQKLNGLLWLEVYQIMMSTPLQIRQFITLNTPDFQSASALDVALKIRDIDLRINEWVAARDDENNPLNSDNFYDWESYSASREKMWGDASDLLKAQAEAKFAEVFKETADINLAGAAADEIYRAVLGDRPRNPNAAGNDGNTSGNNVKDKLEHVLHGGGGSSGNPYGPNYLPNMTAIANLQWAKYYAKQAEEQSQLVRGMQGLQSIINNPGGENGPNSPQVVQNAKKAFNEDYQKLTPENKKLFRGPYKSGGLVNYTGLALVDGTPSRPEAFLNALQTLLLRNHLFGSSDSLLAFARELVQQLHGISYNSNTLQQEENNGVNILHVEVNVNVKLIANDYDVRTIGNTVMDEMLKIARKSGTRSLSRR